MGHDFSGAGSSHDNCYDSSSNRPSPYNIVKLTPLNDLGDAIHAENQHWWHDPATGQMLNRNKGEMLMLIVSEIAEAMEGERKDLMDTHLTHRKMVEVEFADAIIRILDYARAGKMDIDGAIAEKRIYNASRTDHTREARLAAGGKKF
jgi:NTP pyrophosphatase (non-canonical NTP hydrolase)